MRGENCIKESDHFRHKETSPHAWRKRRSNSTAFERAGNISTCVEKTLPSFRMYQRHRKHLHMRGENSPIVVMPRFCVETSPHAWRKHHKKRFINLNIRYIELPYAVFVKNQRKTTNFPDMIKGQSFFQNSVIRRLTYTFNNQQ